MGFLTLFSKPVPTLVRLPSGSFTVDCSGQIVMGTLPSSFPPTLVEAIAQQVLRSFQHAETAGLPLSALVIEYSTLKITARELRGGALIFLHPKSSFSQPSTR